MTHTDNGDLVQEFEESFQKCISVMTEEDDVMERNKELVEKKVEENVGKFLECARQLETFFLQKRFLVFNHKPEMVLKEETMELKAELLRKDELIRKHYEKLGQWQSMLADVQERIKLTYSQMINSGGGGGAGGQQGPPPPPTSGSGPLPPPPGAGPAGPNIRGPTPNLGGPNFMNTRPTGPQMFNQHNLQGPLAYLERTTSNIGGTGGGGPGR